jgi:hypothetical protein
MGSASRAATAAVALVILSCPTASRASILPQIREAEALGTEMGSSLTTPTLRKHYVEVKEGIFVAVKGARERRQVRFARLIDSFGGDRREVYERQGFPVFRYRERAAGVETEHWTYPGKQVTYTFQGDRLIAVDPF